MAQPPAKRSRFGDATTDMFQHMSGVAEPMTATPPPRTRALPYVFPPLPVARHTNTDPPHPAVVPPAPVPLQTSAAPAPVALFRSIAVPAPPHPAGAQPAVPAPVAAAPRPALAFVPLMPEALAEATSRLSHNIRLTAARHADETAPTVSAELNSLLEKNNLLPPASPAKAPKSAAVPRLFTLHTVEPATPEYTRVVGGLQSGFAVEKVFAVNQPFREMSFQIQTAQMECSLPDHSANVQELWHMTRASSIGSVLNFGMDTGHASAQAFFGRGLYFSHDLMKANDYCPPDIKGDPKRLRIVLLCKVALGVVHKFDIGAFNRALTTAPIGCHSVQGFIRRSFENVVYNNQQVLVTHVVVYRFTDPAVELAPAYNVPPNTQGHVVFVTPSLSVFFDKLRARVHGLSRERAELNNTIDALVQRTITPEKFVEAIVGILKAAPPPNIVENIKRELAKCHLPPAIVGTSAGGAAALAPPPPPAFIPPPAPGTPSASAPLPAIPLPFLQPHSAPGSA
jgi:hypothetical protein